METLLYRYLYRDGQPDRIHRLALGRPYRPASGRLLFASAARNAIIAVDRAFGASPARSEQAFWDKVSRLAVLCRGMFDDLDAIIAD
jgi:hypothetical protein